MQSNTYLIPALFALAVGCSEPAPATTPPPVDSSGIPDPVGALDIDIASGGDMDHAAVTVQRVSCHGEPIEPFSIQHQTSPNSPESVVIDEFILLPPGCYNVFVEPRRQDDAPSNVCTSVLLENVVIIDGATTEEMVILNCFNSPPNITNVAFTPDKFVSFCEAQELCVTASDSDADAIEFEWSQISGLPLLAGPTVTKPATKDAATGETVECMTIMHRGPGTVGMSVRSFDLIQLSIDTTMRREDFHAAQGVQQTSRDEVRFTVHGMATADCPCIPNAEICDIFDNDCDGENNEDITCLCKPFEVESCYGGPPETAGVGDCRTGGRICKLDGSDFETECIEEVLPTPEVCDGRDNDCNGIVDDNLSCSP